jgi:hypothetical protein
MATFQSRESQQLAALLHQHGAAGPQVAPALAWEAFKAFGRQVASHDGVGLLFQLGVFNFTGEPLFYFGPVCQFERLDADGEHDGFEQIHCELSCPPTTGLEGVEASLWSFGFASVEEFFQAVESTPQFKAAMAQPAYQLSVAHEFV